MYQNLPMNTNYTVFFKGEEPNSYWRDSCFAGSKSCINDPDVTVTGVQYYPYTYDDVNEMFLKDLGTNIQDTAMEYYQTLKGTDLGKCFDFVSDDKGLIFPVIPDEPDKVAWLEKNATEEYGIQVYPEVGTNLYLFTCQALRLPQEKLASLTMFRLAKDQGYSDNVCVLMAWVFGAEPENKDITEVQFEFKGGQGHQPFPAHFTTKDIKEFVDNGTVPEPKDKYPWAHPFEDLQNDERWYRTASPNRIIKAIRGEELYYAKIGVYGTLKRHHGNHRLIKDAHLVDRACVQLPMKMYDLGAFPALVPDDHLHDITMEIYEVDRAQYEAVERLEGYPRMYDRFSFIHNGDPVDVYYMHEARGTEVKSGQWG